MDLGLAGKVAVVTGGANGIGRQISREFVAEGARVVVADLDDGARAGVEPVVTELERLGGEAAYVATDVADRAQVEALLATAVERFGAVDALVNNAAWWPTPTVFFWEEEPRHWQKMVDVVLMGTMTCCQVVGEHMRQRGAGAIVNIASDSALMGEQKETFYSATKGAVISATYSLANGLGPSGVRVNCVSPGRTVSEDQRAHREALLAAGGDEAARYLDREKRALRYYPLRKYGTPEEVAKVVVAMSSPVLTSHMSGQVVSVSGGYRVG